MPDAAEKFTDAELERVERELRSIYQQTYNDVRRQLAEVVNKMEFTAEMTPQERYLAAQKYNRLTSLSEQLSKSLQDTNREAIRIVNRSTVNVYAENYNQTIDYLQEYSTRTFPTIDKGAVAKILRGEVTPFTQIAESSIKDLAGLERDLTRNLVSGIMQGKSIPNLAKDIRENVVNRDLFRATRIARTETNRIQNAGRQDAFDKGEDYGLNIVKRWVSTHDVRTRESHTAAHGQRVPNGKPFIIGGQELMFPSDQTAAPEESINCRCTMVAEVVTKAEYDEVAKEYEKIK